MLYSRECTVADRVLTIETGKLAAQAESAVTVRYGDTVVLVTTCIGEDRNEASDFVRLTVDYEERHYAVGKIPGSFIRREGRPSEQATLSARLIDRSIRPLLPKNFGRDIQVIVTVLSTDQENAHNLLALIGASTTLALSSVPFKGPVSSVRIGHINGEFVVNPPLPQLGESLLDVVVVSTSEAVVMIETEAKEASEELVIQAIEMGHRENQKLIEMQEEIRKEIGHPKLELPPASESAELHDPIISQYGDRLTEAVTNNDRDERKVAVELLKKEIIEKLSETYEEPQILEVLDKELKKAVRKYILENKKHIDGRAFDDIRPLSSEVGILPRTHGSALFSRGQTQVLAITTLGSRRQEQLIDGLGLEETKRFMHHYNFPPFSTGEAKRIGSTSRREIGHGALAEKAVEQVIPDEDSFSYTIRIVSEVMSSNGSTSMASVCASTLSLMDAGVPIKMPVAGIAMGLVTGDDGSYVVLTDLVGLEDAYGDMDFKVAGTANGITAIQLDIKLEGLPFQIIKDTIYQARDARMKILENMRQAIEMPRVDLSPYAPKMHRLQIDKEKIGALIGPGGKTIRSIIEETKTTIDVDNDGVVLIGSPNEEAAQKAIEMVENLTRDVEVGAIYTGKATRITNFGAFVEILPGKEGLVHISELADYRVDKVEDIVKEGEEITVKVTEIDNMGRVNLSRKAVYEDSPRSTEGGAQESSRDRNQRPSKPRQQGNRRFNSGRRDQRRS